MAHPGRIIASAEGEDLGARASRAGGFARLDDRIGAEGATVVRASADLHEAVVAHVLRRLRSAGWRALQVTAGRGAPVFREVAAKLGLAAGPCDPDVCASAIAAAAVDARAAIVVPLPGEGSWDAAVAESLVSGLGAPLVFFTAGSPPPWADVHEIGPELEPGDRHRWLGAIAEEAGADLPASDLRSLERWWRAARSLASDPARAAPGEGARAALVGIALAGRSLPVRALVALVPEHDVRAAIDELVRDGRVTRAGALVSLGDGADADAIAHGAGDAARVAVARVLLEFDPDPWAHARAAELFLEAGRWDEADRAIDEALRSGIDPSAGAEVAARWLAAVTPIGGADGIALRRKAAERALARGEAHDAQRWCESAAAIAPESPEIALLLGRTLMQLGDLVAARVCLGRAEAASGADVDLSARIGAERAELCFLGGDLAGAATTAEAVLAIGRAPATRLAARGTIGKVLLARGEWDLADEHFAEDAMTASAVGEATAELRARLNRAIALLSTGRLDASRTLLERVLDDATRLREERARAYALSNLGLVAYRQRDYGGALRAWERAIRLPQALRGRVATALTIANLADLRLRLGLVEHAEHALAFGKRLLAGGAPPRVASLFGWVAAQIALARRDTALARREIENAIVLAQASGDRDCLESVHLVAARVALEDGDLAGAGDALGSADEIARSARARAEVAIVRAALLRALGRPALDSANQALRVAARSGEEDLLAEIGLLIATLHLDAGEPEAARPHAARAAALRDQVAEGLSPDVRAAFLAKPETLALARLLDALSAGDARPERARSGGAALAAPTRTRAAGFGPIVGSSVEPPKLVGDDPQIRSLAVAIRKVARSSSTVLIQGESGTGKELVAEALHEASERASGPLVTVNCAALVETLLLSELFGHEKGAFTGATARRRGRFELAEGGTLFLDEIGDISSRTQVALLRVLQERTFERVGGAASIRANVRVIAATHRDLRAMVARGEFREDLYYRLRGITLEVPSLRARLGDLPKIAGHLLGRIGRERGDEPKRLGEDALDLLGRHRWPGNVRELENVLRAVALFAEGAVITAADLIDNVDDLRLLAQAGPSSSSDRGRLRPPSDLPADGADATAAAYALLRRGKVPLSEMKRRIERDCIARALAESDGNITRAAVLLGMKRPRLSQLVKQYRLSTEEKP